MTEIRGPYYTPVGRRYLEDVLETMGDYVDTLKFAGGSFALMPREAVRALNDLCHEHDVEVSTGGFLEYVLTQGADAVAALPRRVPRARLRHRRDLERLRHAPGRRPRSADASSARRRA